MSDKVEYFTNRARQILNFADAETKRLQQNYVGTEHLLLGLMQAEDSLICRILLDMNINPALIKETIDENNVPQPDFKELLGLSDEVKKTLWLTKRELERWQHHKVEPEHLLAALIIYKDSAAIRVLEQLNIDPEPIRLAVYEVLRQLPDTLPAPVESSAKPLGFHLWVWRKDMEAHGVYYETHPTRFSRLRALFRKNNPADTNPS